VPDEKPTIQSAWAATQLDELLAAGDGYTATSKSWDTASRTGNVDSETADVGLASVHYSETGLCQTYWAAKSMA
jgi:hypothetical protein